MFYNLDDICSQMDIDMVLEYYGYNGRKVVNQGTHLFRGSCPFPDHKDSNPSFAIRENGVWSCFVCGTGSVFHFVQRMEDCSFKEAIAHVVKITNYDSTATVDRSKNMIDLFNSTPKKIAEPKFKTLEEITLNPSFDNAEFHFDVAQKRVTMDMIKQYDIRYGTEGYFKDHLIIPIVMNGKCVSFFARDLAGTAKKPKKYPLNAPIGSILFNFDKAKTKDTVLIVEGILDCLKLLSWGYNAVALLGATLTDQKKYLLLKYFDNVHLCLDNDRKINKDGQVSNPGQKAAMLIADALKHEISVKNILLPTGKDPDDCTKEEFEIAYKNALRLG